MRVSQLIRNCAVFLGMVGVDKNFIPYGTGFVIALGIEGVGFAYVVTCKHVIDRIIEVTKSDRVWIRVNTVDGKAEPISVNIREWIFDTNNDVAVYSHYFNQNTYKLTFITEESFATKDKINELEIEPGEFVYMVGLFLNHYGTEKNMPIVRMGNIAAIPEEPVYTKIGYLKGYLIEMRSIGGFSGSPVLTTILPCRVLNKKVVYGGKMETLLLGMMHGLYVLEEPSIELDDGDSKADAMNAGIGVVIPIDTIMTTINGPEFNMQRNNTLRELKEKCGVRPAVTSPPAENPQHKEDFSSLVTAAAKKKKPTDET